MKKTGFGVRLWIVCMMVWMLLPLRVYASAEFTSARPISVNSDEGDSIENTFRFNLESDGMIQVQFLSEKQDNSNTIWYLHLYDSSYKELEFDCPITGNVSETYSAQMGLPKGQYYFYVESNQRDPGSYRFNIHYTASNLWEKERNDSFTQATILPLNTTLSGSSIRASYDDYYKLTLPQDGSVSIRFCAPRQSSASTYWYLYVYNGEYKEIGYVPVTGNVSETVSASVGLPKGEYYIKVEPNANWMTDTYTITAQYSPSAYWEKEDNGSFVKATPMETEKEYSGSIFCYRSEDDYYKLNVTKGGDYVIMIRSKENLTANSCWDVYLVGNDYRDIKNFSGKGDQKTYSMKIYLSPGSYFLRVQAGGTFTQGTYMISANETSTLIPAAKKPATCKIKSAKNNKKKTIKVTWKKNGAEYYEVQISTDKNFRKKVESYQTPKTSVTIKKRKKKKNYYIRVRAIKDHQVGEWSAVKKVKVKK